MQRQQSAPNRPPRPRSSEERFVGINRERLRRIREALTPRQRDFLELLPLLFHSNHPLLPGYVNQTTPCGVRDYTPTQETLTAAQRVTRSYSHERRILPRLDIMGLYMMGSCGTIAYTPGSDFDIWLCHTPGLEESAVADLRLKAARIEEAAKDLNLDVHFFVFDPESFRRGELASLSAESSGSSQHYLLLDEFYRSAVVLAGLYPLWWRVPPEQEREYSTAARTLVQGRFIGQHDYIDFGGLERVPAEEFFGAAVWHIYKSINSPYKSVLKLILIEAYAQEYPDIDLLALHYKRLVYDGETNLNAIDPYLLMYRKVEDYLTRRGDTARLHLFRRCFYFKVEERLTARTARGEESWRREVLRELVGSWGWDTAHLALLDSRDQWKVPVVLEQRRDLIAALTQSYRLLSQFGREQADSARISQRDLHVLGRKLYSAFERKAGKIEIVNRGIAPDIAEQRLSIHLLGDAATEPNWLLFTDAVLPEDIGQHTAVRRSNSIVDVLAWCHFNRIIAGETQITAYAGAQPYSARELRSILGALEGTFPGGLLGSSDCTDLTRAPQLLRAALFVNVGLEHRAGPARSADMIASSRTDPLSFGGMHHNLSECFDLVLMTSWEEVFSFHYRGLDGLLQCLCEYLRLRANAGSATVPETFTTHCFSPGHGANISQRFHELFDDISRSVQETAGHWRYILEAADHYYAIVRDDGGIRFERIGNHAGLIAFLGRPVPRYTHTRFDRYALRNEPLPRLYEQNRQDAIQTFYRVLGREVELFVIDERGSLFTQTLTFHNQHVLLDQLARFFRSTSQRMTLGSNANGESRRIGFEFRHLAGGARREFTIEPVSYNPDLGRQYLQIKVLLETGEDSSHRYTVICDGREFSSLAHGADLFRVVARHVLSVRTTGSAYPIYITDIDLSGVQLPGESDQTVRLLEQKRLIEERLNRALADLAATG